MNTKRCFLSLPFVWVGLCILFTALAEDLSSLSQEPKSERNQIQAHDIEVSVTNISVIVKTKEGVPVTGLQPDQFEIYEDGVLQRMTNFFEVKGSQSIGIVPDKTKEEAQKVQLLPTLPETIQNKIVFFFDTRNLHPLNGNWVAEKIKPFIQQYFAESQSNLGMVAFLSNKLEIVQEFTSDSYSLLSAVGYIKSQPGEGLLRLRAREEMRREINRLFGIPSSLDVREKFLQALEYARGFVEDEMNNQSFSLKSLDAFMDYLSGIQGRKILIYISDGLKLNPAREIFDSVGYNDAFGNIQMETMNYDMTPEFKELVARCNAREISVYPIDAEKYDNVGPSAESDKGRILDRPVSGVVNLNVINKDDALELMAEETGGSFIKARIDLEKGLQSIEQDLKYYYSLGYRSSHESDNRYHSIEVKLKGVGGDPDVRFRRGFIKGLDEDSVSQAVTARLFLAHQENPLGIKIQILPVEKLPFDLYKLTLKIYIPLDKVTLTLKGREYTGKIKITVALLDSKNYWSDPEELFEEIKISLDEIEEAKRSYYPYLAELQVRRESYRISLGVTDLTVSTTSYVQLTKDIRD